MSEVTPEMLKAAWVEARQWWPRKFVENEPCKHCGHPENFRIVETCIRVDHPVPGFREAIEAALRAKSDT